VRGRLDYCARHSRSTCRLAYLAKNSRYLGTFTISFKKSAEICKNPSWLENALSVEVVYFKDWWLEPAAYRLKCSVRAQFLHIQINGKLTIVNRPTVWTDKKKG
jgi:hypothetical protein